FNTHRRYSETDDLREAVHVDRTDVERLLDCAAHALGPRLSAEEAGAELQPAGVLDVVGDGERVARRAAEDLRAEVFEQLRLARRVPARRGHDSAAEALGTVMEPEAAGEQAVPVCNVHERAGPSA